MSSCRRIMLAYCWSRPSRRTAKVIGIVLALLMACAFLLLLSYDVDSTRSVIQPGENVAKGLEFHDRQFVLDGKPLRIIGGSFHYFRTRPEQWQDRLERMKAAGLNTVTTYIAWNLHERRRGVYDFSADGYDLAQFIRLVQRLGLYLIIRPGPYICAEWEFGGFPSWLLHDPYMVLRSSRYKPYLSHVERFYAHLLPKIRRFTFRNGGPIIAFQVENEFGSYKTSPDPAYLQFIVHLFKINGIQELLLASDVASNLAKGTIDELLPTINFNSDPAGNLNKLIAFRQDKFHLMVTEFWPGWFDHWGENHHEMKVSAFHSLVTTVLKFNASINFYMFTGGTNFGFWNGANNESRYEPTITSYDYDALISECGDVHPTKYQSLRNMLVNFGLVSESQLPPIPENPHKVAYGQIKIEESMPFEAMCEVVGEKPITLNAPTFMEFLDVNSNGGQGYGWILYRARIHGNSINVKGELNDRAQIFVNGKHVSTVYSTASNRINKVLSVESSGGGTGVLEVLVENMGRVNYRQLDNQRKGFQGEVTVDGKKIIKWEHIPLEFDSGLIKKLALSKKWSKTVNSTQTMPTLHRTILYLKDKPEDTFLDMNAWTKGIVIVNDFVIGRYWNVGPQQTLYVPWSILNKGSNEIIVFELEKPATHMTFVDKPVLNKRQ